MNQRRMALFFLILALVSYPLWSRCLTAAIFSGPRAASAQTSDPTLYLPVVLEQDGIKAPVLKWQKGGCYSSWCETGWNASPAVADVDGDSQQEVVGAAYSLFILNGATGTLKRRVDPPGDREWPGVVVADLDQNGTLEIVTAHGQGYVNVYDRVGARLLWSQRPVTSELRSLAVYDLEGDGKLEVVVAVAAYTSDNQWYVYDSGGNPRPGWPQLAPDQPGSAAGAYNENIGIADLDGDKRGEIIGPSDVHCITAYEDNGAQIQANAMFDVAYPTGPKYWSEVCVNVDEVADLRGWTECDTERRPNFADSAPTLADLNNDGVREVVVVFLTPA